MSLRRACSRGLTPAKLSSKLPQRKVMRFVNIVGCGMDGRREYRLVDVESG